MLEVHAIRQILHVTTHEPSHSSASAVMGAVQLLIMRTVMKYAVLAIILLYPGGETVACTVDSCCV